MIINVTGMTRMMAKEYKADGYQALLDENTLYLMGTGWAAKIARPDVPPKIMAMLVQHLEQLPSGNFCHLVREDGINDEIEATFRENFASLERASAYDGPAIKPTPVTYRHTRLWQKEKDLSLMRVRQGLMALLQYKKDTRTVCALGGNMIHAYGEVSWLSISSTPDRTDTDTAQMDYLAGMQWVQWD